MTPALDLLATLRLADGRRWIDAAYDFQLADARAVLDLDGPPLHFITRSRGSSKTGDLAAAALAKLVTAPPRSRLYWLAADRDQGALAIDAIGGYAQRTPAIGSRLEIGVRKVTALDNGASLEVLPADAPSAWGLNPYALFVDELANWTDGPAARRLWEAASSAVAKNTAARLVVLTTAGSPDHFARGILDHALGSDLWRVHERPGPAPWADPERLAEQRSRLPASVYEQLFENRWTAAEGSFLDPALVDAAFALDGPAIEASGSTGGYVAGLDLGTTKDRTAFAVGHREGDLVVLDRLQVWKPSRLQRLDFAEVEAFIVAAHQRFGFTLHLDPWQGLDLAQRLRGAGVNAREYNFSATSKQRLASTLLQLVNSGHLRLYEAEGLREELMKLRLVQSKAGAWSFDHDRRGHDDRAVALSLMAVAALEGGGKVEVSTLPSPWGDPAKHRAWFAERDRRERREANRVELPPPPPPLAAFEDKGQFRIHHDKRRSP